MPGIEGHREGRPLAPKRRTERKKLSRKADLQTINKKLEIKIATSIRRIEKVEMKLTFKNDNASIYIT